MGCGRNDVGGTHEHRDRFDEFCICETVRAIKRIQDIGADEDCEDCETDCFMAPLGTLVSPARMRFNTRVFVLLNKDGEPFKTFFRPESEDHHHGGDKKNCFTVFFRVSRIFDNCCATLQALAPLDEHGHPVDLIKHGKLDLEKLCDVKRFGPTETCVTVDLKCFCGIQCITDTFIDFCDLDD